MRIPSLREVEVELDRSARTEFKPVADIVWSGNLNSDPVDVELRFVTSGAHQ